MKKTRRIAAFIAAMAMATCAVAPAMMMNVSATDVSIASGDNATHTYKAYQIFAGTYDATLGLQVTGWGTNYNSAGLLADAAFQTMTGATTTDSAAAVAQKIEALNYASSSTQADALAAILQKYVGATSDETLDTTAKDLAAGYWIVLDSYTADADEGTENDKPDAVSKYILRVTGGSEAITITPKKSYPTVVKKVKENTDVSDYTYTDTVGSKTDADYNDVADYNINDSVPFKLYGTLPSDYADYEHYYYKFTDTLDAAFTAPTVANVTVKVNGTEITNAAGKTNMRVAVSGQTITVSFEDIKEFAPNATDVITVEYSAVLNENAVIGLDGQENKVDLTYSNNPNFTYAPDTTDSEEDVPKDDNGTPEDETDDKEVTDKTPEDKVIVFTYQQNIKKVDAATGNPLSAVFTLSRINGTKTEYVQVDANNKVTGWTETEASASELTTDATTGLCSVIGLDDGVYTVKEKTPPAGYNEIDNSMTLTITATTDNGQNWTGTASDALTGITLTVSGDTHISDDSASLSAADVAKKGIVQAKITNDKGIALPETGGMGTKAFVAGGGLTALLAGVWLATKKRMGKED